MPNVWLVGLHSYTAPYTIAPPKCTYREYSHKHSYRPHSTGNISTLAARLRCRCVCTAYRCVYIEVVYRLLDDVCRQQFNTVCDCEKLWAAHFNANCGSTKTFRILSSPVKCAVLLNKQKKLCLVFRQTDKKKKHCINNKNGLKMCLCGCVSCVCKIHQKFFWKLSAQMDTFITQRKSALMFRKPFDIWLLDVNTDNYTVIVVVEQCTNYWWLCNLLYTRQRRGWTL